MAVPFVVNEVIVAPGNRHQDAYKLVVKAAALAGLEVRDTDHSRDLARVLGDPDYRRTPRSLRLTDRPDDFRIADAADAPAVVRHAKFLATDDEVALMIGINRVLSAHAVLGSAPSISPHGTGGLAPYISPHAPYISPHGSGGLAPYISPHDAGGAAPYVSGHDVAATYAMLGSGGRQPVDWVGSAPTRTPGLDRRPVVVTLDTGLGRHPWFAEGCRTGLELDGVQVGYTDARTDPERSGVSVGVLSGALASHSGHGTFIAGLIRQLCPDADLHAVRVMTGDGIADEYELLRCLLVLAELVRRHRDPARGDGLGVDIVVLSLGYVHESAQDALYDTFLLPVLEELGALGVAVVAAAGNNASEVKVYPAAFAPHPGGQVPAPKPGVVPVTSVGSLNPNGSVALFSNAGSWVRCWEGGAALVSTMPTTLSGGAMPSVSYRAADGSVRQTIDLDDFTAGFGVWSGTSFAAPVFAGRLAQALLDTGRLGELGPDEISTLVGELADRQPLPRGRKP